MSQAVRFQEVLRKLAIIDERCVADQAGLSLALPTSALLDPKTAALVQVGVLMAIGSPAVTLEWGITRALSAGATADEITGVLLAVGPAAGLGRVAGAVRALAAALGYDIEGALFDPDGDLRLLFRQREHASGLAWTSRQSGTDMKERWRSTANPARHRGVRGGT